MLMAEEGKTFQLGTGLALEELTAAVTGVWTSPRVLQALQTHQTLPTMAQVLPDAVWVLSAGRSPHPQLWLTRVPRQGLGKLQGSGERQSLPRQGFPRNTPGTTTGPLLLPTQWKLRSPLTLLHPLPSCWRQGAGRGKHPGASITPPPPNALPPHRRCRGRARHRPPAAALPSARSIRGLGHRVPTSTGVSGCSPLRPAPSPLTTPSPRSLLPPQWFIGVGDESPRAAAWKAPWGCRGGTPRARAPAPAAGTDFQPH